MNSPGGKSPKIVFSALHWLYLLFSNFRVILLSMKACFIVFCRQLKFRVTKIEASPTCAARPVGCAISVAATSRNWTRKEIEEIYGFVEDGGTLIVAGGDHESLNSLLLDYGLEMRKASNSLRNFTPNSN